MKWQRKLTEMVVLGAGRRGGGASTYICPVSVSISPTKSALHADIFFDFPPARPAGRK